MKGFRKRSILSQAIIGQQSKVVEYIVKNVYVAKNIEA